MEKSGKRRGAFFDVDYTILAGNSASLFIKFMRQEGKVGIGTILLSLYYLLRYKLGLLDFERLAEGETMKYAGSPEQGMIDLCDRWFEEMVVHRIYPEARVLIDQHKAKGDVVALLSAATVYLVGPLAGHLGVEHYLCNYLEVDERKRFTGKLVRPISYGTGKIELADRLAAELDIDLADSYYYSDSITDLPVLEHFGHPVAVNPDPLLRKTARARKWPIIDFKPHKA